jgi:LPS export ABC transporter protein LptC
MRFFLCAVFAAVLATAPQAARADEMRDATAALSRLDAELRLTGMTYVGSRGGHDEFVLRAERADFKPETQRAQLEQVHVVATGADAEQSFDVRCAHGELDVESNDFLAQGDVRGSTGDGRSYQADWVRYDHERALLYTDAPVVVRDDTGVFRGDGFRYHVKERRFRLLGNVSVVQEP